MVALNGFMRYLICRVDLQKLMSSMFVSYYLSILSYISIKFSHDVLSEYAGLKGFMVNTYTQDDQNSWQCGYFWTPKTAILATFHHQKIQFQKNFTTISTIFC